MVEISVNSAGYKASFLLFFITDASGSSLLNSVKLNTALSKYALSMHPLLPEVCGIYYFFPELSHVGIIAHIEAVLLYFCGYFEALQQLLLCVLFCLLCVQKDYALSLHKDRTTELVILSSVTFL